MGTPDIAVTALQTLCKKYEVILVVTQPDNKKDRKNQVVYSAVKQYCLQNNLNLIQPLKIKDEYETIKKLMPDLIVTCAYGQFVSEKILNIPKYKSVNLHASLLPKLRGGAPMQWAIIKGYKETGLTLMYMDKLMDHGNIIKQLKIAIDPLTMTYSELYEKMKELIIEMITKHFDEIFSLNVKSIKQIEQESTYGLNIKKQDRYIDWNKTGEEIIYLINGLANEPLALTKINNLEFKINQAKFLKQNVDTKYYNGQIVKKNKNELLIKVCNGYISILKIQAPNKKMLDIKNFLQGNNYFKINEIFENVLIETKE